MALNFIDLFAGAGGLSEGFIRAGYTPLAHIEMDKYACDTLKTRAAFQKLALSQFLKTEANVGNFSADILAEEIERAEFGSYRNSLF